MPKKPQILRTKIIAKSRIFSIEQLDLRFSNGEERTFERLRGHARGAVMIVPMLDEETVLLIREYAAGTDAYELGFPKGLLEDNEDLYTAADREMQEEIGYGAKQFDTLKTMTISPGYWGASMHILLARDLYESKLEGDEPEEIEVVPWRLSQFDELLAQDDFREARSIAALFLLRERLRQGNI